MARGLARAGCKVVVTAARETNEIDEVASEFNASRVLALTADVTRPEDCQRVVEATVAQFGRLDVLVNNAGRGMKYISDRFMTDATPFRQTDPAAWQMIMDTNVDGTFFMARAAVPRMLSQRRGRIINVSASYGTMQRRGFSPYGPSKAAVESMTAIWAQDLADTGVTVNALLPGGPTLTGMVPASFPQAMRSQLLAPEVMVPPLLWLASDASDETTGKRLVANMWRDGPGAAAARQAAVQHAGWAAESGS